MAEARTVRALDRATRRSCRPLRRRSPSTASAASTRTSASVEFAPRAGSRGGRRADVDRHARGLRRPPGRRPPRWRRWRRAPGSRRAISAAGTTNLLPELPGRRRRAWPSSAAASGRPSCLGPAGRPSAIASPVGHPSAATRLLLLVAPELGEGQRAEHHASRSNGSGAAVARPACSRMAATSRKPRPAPPCSSGMATPRSPASATCGPERRDRSGAPSDSSPPRAGAPGACLVVGGSGFARSTIDCCSSL